MILDNAKLVAKVIKQQKWLRGSERKLLALQFAKALAAQHRRLGWRFDKARFLVLCDVHEVVG